MKIRVGFELVYEFAQKCPMVLMLNVHPSRSTDLVRPDHLRITVGLEAQNRALMDVLSCTRHKTNVHEAGRLLEQNGQSISGR